MTCNGLDEIRGAKFSLRRDRPRYEGRLYQLEVRSKRGRGFWIMVTGKAVVHGARESIALAEAIKAIVNGRRLA